VTPTPEHVPVDADDLAAVLAYLEAEGDPMALEARLLRDDLVNTVLDEPGEDEQPLVPDNRFDRDTAYAVQMVEDWLGEMSAHHRRGGPTWREDMRRAIAAELGDRTTDGDILAALGRGFAGDVALTVDEAVDHLDSETPSRWKSEVLRDISRRLNRRACDLDAGISLDAQGDQPGPNA
jgi:hypothetical protein